MTHRLISELEVETEVEDMVVDRLRDWPDRELDALEHMVTEWLKTRD